MRNLVILLLAAGLNASPALCATAAPAPDPLGLNRLEAAQTAEAKGDQARTQHIYDGAISFYLDAVKNSPRNPMLYNKLGIVELKLDNHRSARHYFDAALKIDPQNSIALNNLGAVACTDGKYKSAVHYLKEALALDESDATAHLNMAEAWMGLGESERAMTEYSRALELDADILSNNLDGVVAQVRTPEQRALICFLIAKAYAKRGNVEGALEYLRRAKENRYPALSRVYVQPEFATVVQDPRIAQIVKR